MRLILPRATSSNHPSLAHLQPATNPKTQSSLQNSQPVHPSNSQHACYGFDTFFRFPLYQRIFSCSPVHRSYFTTNVAQGATQKQDTNRSKNEQMLEILRSLCMCTTLAPCSASKCMLVYQTYVGSMNDKIKRLFRERLTESESIPACKTGKPLNVILWCITDTNTSVQSLAQT